MIVQSVSIVIPCYNEMDCISEFYCRVSLMSDSLPQTEFEFIFINDGSTDKTPEILNSLAQKDSRVKVLHLAKNSGHQIALTAGLDFASGDMIVTIDADLQDPPEIIPLMKLQIEKGYDIIHAQRRNRAGENRFKLGTAWLFYKLMHYFGASGLVENSGDFRAFTKQVLNVVCSFREQHRFLRGIFATLGFKQFILQYDRDPRYAGNTKYPLRKMVKFAIDATLSFSAVPLRIIIGSSILLWLISLIYSLVGLYEHFVLHNTVPGWTSVIVVLTFSMGLVLFCLAILGSYVGRIFAQVQGRPLYWLRDWKNFGSELPRPSPHWTFESRDNHQKK